MFTESSPGVEMCEDLLSFLSVILVDMSKPSVLFVCIHNAGRSQMAAAFLSHLSRGEIDVRSAGTEPTANVNPAGQGVEAIRPIRDEIEALVRALIGELAPSA